MGVHGLWKLVEPSGKIVPLDTLENKVLAVDVSIWLHQALKGFQDARGNAVPNAHLLGLFHRICKLLFYKIKPVFVFDGGTPHLKKQTVAARRQQKSKAEQRSEEAREKLLKNIIKHKALRKVLGQHAAAGEADLGATAEPRLSGDMFQLPPMQPESLDQGSGDEMIKDDIDDEDDALEEVLHEQHYKDLHSINVKSAEFKALPANVRHDILSELKETRKQSSWGRLHEIPKESGNFSSYQMERLLKRRSVQVSLEEAEKEMGGRTLSLGELEELLCDQGVVLPSDVGSRIASDNITKYLYITEKQDGESKRGSLADSGSELSELSSSPEKPGTSKSTSSVQVKDTELTKVTELDSCLPREMESSISQKVAISSDEDQDDVAISTHDPLLQVARDFMMENSSLTQEQILSVIKNQNIPEETAGPTPTTSPHLLKLENLIDQNKVDLENLGVTQKEILAMIQEELARCKEILEVESKGLPGEDTLVTGDGAICMNVRETEASNSGFACLPADMDSSVVIESKGPSIESTSTTRDVMICETDTLNSGIASVADSSKEAVPEVLSGRCTSASKNDETFRIVGVNSLNSDVAHVIDSSVEAVSEALPGKGTSVTGDVGTVRIICETEISNPGDVDALPKLQFQAPDMCLSPSKQVASISTSGETALHKSDVEVKLAGETKLPSEENRSTSDESDSDFVEVREKQVNHSNESQGKGERLNQPIETLFTKTVMAAEDDIFADVFLNADTKELDKIVGKLNKPSDGIPKTSVTGSSVPCVPIKETFTPGKISSAEVAATDLRNVSARKGLDSAGDDTENKQSKVVSADNTVKNTPGSEDENVGQEVVPATMPVAKLNLEDLHKLQVNLEEEHINLLAEKGKQERLAASITDQTYLEAQELLRLFGIPYIVAPMEAEAQCAFLDIMSLTDGTITDDSDIWLFGGQRVYKNFFNHKKQVLQFQATDIHHYFKLSREQLVLLALLVGSDYTVGLPGVGPVTALEILGVFPHKQPEQDLLQGLKTFRDWLRSGIGMGPGKAALRSKLKNVHVHEGFPSMSVVDAYLHPQVDESRETFSWGTPDLISLQNFARKKFSWTSKKTDEILLPVLKRLGESKSQKSIDSYFKVETVLQAADGKMSRRVQQAVRRIGGAPEDDCEEPRPKKPRKARSQQAALKKQNVGFTGPQNPGELVTQSSRVVGENENSVLDVSDVPGTSGSNASPSKEVIPQRERDKINSLKNKMKAIEVFRKSKFGLDRTKRDRRAKRQILKEAYLSESSSDSN